MKKSARRTRRINRSRKRIYEQRAEGVHALSVFRSHKHIYAQVFDPLRQTVLASASTVEPDMRSKKFENKTAAAEEVGRRVGEKIKKLGIKVAFDRSGYKYHGRVAAVANGARAAGVEF